MKKTMAAVLVLCLGALAGSAPQAKDSKAEAQAKIRSASQKILNKLYSMNPKAKAAVQKAAGYAVFSASGTKILVAGGGFGKGIAVNNATKREVFMKMAEVQAGLGFGIKKFQLVWVFETEASLNSFMSSGWEIGGQATAAATTGSTGAAYQGAVSVAPGIWLYQMTDKGLALELTAKGTKYYKDDDLN
jgi:lipid-binding SYLF domain-containing protein